MTGELVGRLREELIVGVPERRALVRGRLAERLIKDRLEAADEIVRLRSELIESLRGNLSLVRKLRDLKRERK